MPFTPTVISRPVRVDRVVTVHYFEYSSSYYFEGEQHDFWEFVYVDKGEVDVQGIVTSMVYSEVENYGKKAENFLGKLFR